MFDATFDNITWFEYPTEIIWWQLGGYLLAIAWAGFVIGCFGVGGGVVKMPLALLLPGMTPTVAAGCIFAGAFPMAICRNLQLMYFGRLTVRKALPLIAGGTVGALLGQLALPHLPGEAVGLLVAALAIWAGVQTHRKVMRELRAKKRAEAEQQRAAAGGRADDESPGDACKGAAAAGEAAAATAEVALADVTLDFEEEGKVARSGLRRARVKNGCLHALHLVFPGLLPAFCAETAGPAATPKVGAAAPDIEGPPPAVAPQELEPEQQRQTREDIGAMAASGDPPLKCAEDGPSRIFSLDHPAADARQRCLQILCQVGLGLVSSFFSSISGTGGPAIFFPLGMLLDPQVSMRTLVAMSAPFAAVMTSFSALGAVFFGQIDLGLALLSAVVGILSSQVGGLLMERMGDTKLKAGIGAILVLVGVSLAVKVGSKLVA